MKTTPRKSGLVSKTSYENSPALPDSFPELRTKTTPEQPGAVHRTLALELSQPTGVGWSFLP